MAKRARVTLEIGPKGKRVVAVAPDWPGLERGGKTKDEALEKLRAYIPRYATVAKLAGLQADFDGVTDFRVIEQYRGTGSTDFWGISFAFSSVDQQRMSTEQLERELALVRACWKFFDHVRARVSAVMQKGPRGGGRDRDRIVMHVFNVEKGWAQMVGALTPDEAPATPPVLKAHRRAYLSAIRDYHARRMLAGKVAKWPLRYLVRHTAFHTLDHAWEMQDKDLTPRKA